MKKLTGKIAFRDIETGVWVLEGDDGRTYQIVAGDRKLKKEGQRVEVEGNVDEGALTSAMVGPTLSVKKFKVT